jgi:ABC-type antimicrobial peptide transport system permease subunit
MNQLREALLPLLPAKYRTCIKFSPFLPTTTRQFIFQHKAITARGAVGALGIILVALIGLTNMLLVSVHEAIHETGLRRALGAKRRHVIIHFLSEGALLSMVGTGAGLTLGILFCWLTRSQTSFPIVVSIFWATAGALSLIGAGIIASLLPALIAAKINPIDALHYE